MYSSVLESSLFEVEDNINYFVSISVWLYVNACVKLLGRIVTRVERNVYAPGRFPSIVARLKTLHTQHCKRNCCDTEPTRRQSAVHTRTPIRFGGMRGVREG